MSRADQLEGGACFRFIVEVPVRVVPAAAVGDLPGGETEEEEVLDACFLRHLDGGAIPGTQCQGPVHHEFHVARAAGLVAGGRDLVGDVRGGNQDFRQRDIVLGQEQHFYPPANERIGVDGVGKIVDELDDQLGEMVGGRGLACEYECARGERGVRVGAQAVVQDDEAQCIQQ